MSNSEKATIQTEKKSVWSAIWTKPMFITLLFGFASGLPLLLTLRTLQAWMTDVGVDLKTVGVFSLATMPYSLKFLWAPIMDKYSLFGFGRRRGWLLLTQICLIICLCFMATINPKEQTWLLALLAVFVAFFSASQDIAADAFRREYLSDDELAMGSTIFVNGYKIAMWVSGGLALALAQWSSWSVTYYAMAGFMFIGVATTIWSTEPENANLTPKTIKEAAIDPLVEFFKRDQAFLILAFVLLYKLGDTMAGSMLTPFYLKLGYSKLEIAAVAKTLSLPITVVGGFVGAALTYKLGMIRCLWLFGIGQMVSTLSPIILLYVDHSLLPLGLVILLEDFTQAMATATFVAFMMSLTNKRFTGTQYALLSSLIGIPRSILSSPTGYLAENLGWLGFFVFCTIVAIPGLLLIRWMIKLQKPNAG